MTYKRIEKIRWKYNGTISYSVDSRAADTTVYYDGKQWYGMIGIVPPILGQ